MGDHDDAGAALLQTGQQVEYLPLHRHVHGRGGLVGDQQRRLRDHGHGDHRPLPHPAGQLERIEPNPAFRLGNADIRQRLHGTLLGLRFAADAVPEQVFGELALQGEGGVHRLHRILEHHPDVSPPDAAHLPFRQSQQVAAIEPGRSGRGAGGARQQTKDRAHRHALAAAALADDRQRPARCDVEPDPVDGAERFSVLLPELGTQVFDPQQRLVRRGRRGVVSWLGHRHR